jgi:hypothetical protein
LIFSADIVSSEKKGAIVFIKSKGKLIVFISVFFSFFLSACAQATIEEDGLRQFLPEKKLNNWQAEDSPQQYTGDDLYLYINGGAEIYHEYGFEQVIVQDYSNKQGKSISLELFEMSGPESAFGMYAFKSSSLGKELSIGDGAALEDYYLNFWKGKYLITLTGFDADEETVLGLKQIAESMDAKIKSTASAPKLVKMLPEEGLIKPGIKYFKGPLALMNSFKFFSEENIPLREGVRGDYAAGHSVFIFKYESIDEGLINFGEVKEKFISDSAYQGFKERKGRSFSVMDEAGELLFCQSSDRYIFILLGTGSFSEAEEIIGAISR